MLSAIKSMMAIQLQMQRLINWVSYPNISIVTDTTYVKISDKKIKEFMKFYRESFPWATVLPKMHMLEEHVLPWLRRWHVGFGLMGEQGAESIHACFNSLKTTYRGVPNPVRRLKLMMHEHFLQIAPSNIAAKPAVKKRKKSVDS